MPAATMLLISTFIVSAFAPKLAMAARPTVYSDGLKAYQNGDLREAQASLLQVDSEKTPHAAYLLGIINEQRGQYKEAIRWYDQYAVHGSPSSALYQAARAHKAFSLVMDGQFQRAQARIAEAPAESKDVNTCLVFALAELSLGIKDHDKTSAEKAAKRYRLILDSLDPESADAMNGYGRAQLLLGDLDKSNAKAHLTLARDHFIAATKKNPLPVYFNNLGVSYFWLEDRERAKASFQEAIRRADTNSIEHRDSVKKAKDNLELLGRAAGRSGG